MKIFLLLFKLMAKKEVKFVPSNASQSEVESIAMDVENVKKAINNDIRKIIYVPKRILNIVL